MTEAQYADCPLTLFDGRFQGFGVVVGWLIEGLLDLQKVDDTVSGLVVKWPMLSGRLQTTGVCPRIPLREPLTHLNEPIGEARSQNQSAPGSTPRYVCPIFTHFKEFHKANHGLCSTPSSHSVRGTPNDPLHRSYNASAPQ